MAPFACFASPPHPFYGCLKQFRVCCRTLTGAVDDVAFPLAALPSVAYQRLRIITPCGRKPRCGFLISRLELED